MAKKLTNKEILNGIIKARNTYNAAASKAPTVSTQEYLSNKWAMLNDIAKLLAHKDKKMLEDLVKCAESWLETT